MAGVKEAVLRILTLFRIFPHILFTFHCWKIYEFNELLKGVQFSKDDIILDLGSGIGLQAMILGKKGKKTIGIDSAEAAVAAAGRLARYLPEKMDVEFRCSKIENAGFENEYFDKVFSVCVIEHIPNYIEVLREVHRVLKKGGQLVFSADSMETVEDEEILERHRKDYSVQRYFSRDELIRILEETGFQGIQVYPIFKSDFARKILYRGVRKPYRRYYLRAIPEYLVLKYKERRSHGDKGIILVAKCLK